MEWSVAGRRLDHADVEDRLVMTNLEENDLLWWRWVRWWVCKVDVHVEKRKVEVVKMAFSFSPAKQVLLPANCAARCC